MAITVRIDFSLHTSEGTRCRMSCTISPDTLNPKESILTIAGRWIGIGFLLDKLSQLQDKL